MFQFSLKKESCWRGGGRECLLLVPNGPGVAVGLRLDVGQRQVLGAWYPTFTKAGKAQGHTQITFRRQVCKATEWQVSRFPVPVDSVRFSDYAASFDNELFRFFSISVNKPGITLCAGFLKSGMIEEGGSARVC